MAEEKDIFGFTDYKHYLREVLRGKPARGHGFRSRMAEAAQCRVAYVSRVLNQDAEFSLEQAEALNPLLGHTEDESSFFLLLVQYGRAGTHALRTRLGKQIAAIREQRLILKNRVDIKATLGPAEQAIYYGSWIYAAIHILVTIERYRDREAIAKRLGIPLEKTSKAIEFLSSIGLVKIEAGRIVPGVSRIFLGSDSPMIARHHANWRLKAMETIDRDPAEGIHLSTLLSVARKDVPELKEALLKAINGIRERARDSAPEEELCCFCVDFFGL